MVRPPTARRVSTHPTRRTEERPLSRLLGSAELHPRPALGVETTYRGAMAAATTPKLPPLVRALGVAALLLGLVAMHGLVSDHHRAGPTVAAAISHVGHVSGSLASEALQAGTTVDIARCAPGCDQGTPVTLCLAVLTAAIGWLSSRRGRVRAPDQSASVPADSFVALRRGPPRLDPVSQLCVSRT